MKHRSISLKENDFIILATKKGKRKPALIRAWYRGLPRLKRDLTPNDRLLAEYPN